MNVVYHDRAKQGGEGYVLLQQATERLKEVLGGSADSVRVEWDQADDERGRVLCTLTLRDHPDEAKARFAPDELTQPPHMRVRLYRLWGELLQARNHRQLRHLREDGGLED